MTYSSLKRGKPLQRTRMKRSRPDPDRGVEFSDDVRRLVRRRAKGVCEAKCTKACTGAIRHFHHRRMRSQGGKGTIDNCLGVCLLCHVHIHAHPMESYLRGWLIRARSLLDQ